MIQTHREVRKQLKKELEPVKLQGDSVKANLLSVTQSLKSQVEQNANDLKAYSKSPSSIPSTFTSDIKDLQSRVLSLENSTAKLTIQDSESIKFNGLGFSGKPEADAWLNLSSPNGTFGLIVDYHILMEHIHYAISGVDAMKQLQNVYKLKMSTISEAVAITS